MTDDAPIRSANESDGSSELENLSRSWETAQKHLQLIRTPHRLFTNCIRALRSSPAGRPTEVIMNGPLHVLFRSDNFKSVVYHATSVIHPEKIKPGVPLTGMGLLTAIDADELCSVVAAMYLYRLIGRDCEPQIWEELTADLEIQMRAGIRVGSAIPAIGSAAGLLVGAIRYLAMSLFAIRDQKSFKTYRRTLRQKELLFDLALEESLWGCNHLQIASLLLQALGFGIDASQGVSSPGPLPADSASESWRWYAARRWIESVVITERYPPEFPPGHTYFPASEQAFAELQAAVDQIYEGDRTTQWIAKGRADLPKDICTALGDLFSRRRATASEEASVKEAFEE